MQEISLQCCFYLFLNLGEFRDAKERQAPQNQSKAN